MVINQTFILYSDYVTSFSVEDIGYSFIKSIFKVNKNQCFNS